MQYPGEFVIKNGVADDVYEINLDSFKTRNGE